MLPVADPSASPTLHTVGVTLVLHSSAPLIGVENLRPPSAAVWAGAAVAMREADPSRVKPSSLAVIMMVLLTRGRRNGEFWRLFHGRYDCSDASFPGPAARRVRRRGS